MLHLDRAIALYDKAVVAAKEIGDEDAGKIFVSKSSILRDLRGYLR